MAIISSKIISENVQVDGRVYITEHHTTDTGLIIPVTYLAEADDDHEARMAARVPQLEAQLATEAQEAIDRIVLASAQEKVNAHLKTFTDTELKTEVGLTDEEVAIFKESLSK